MGKQHRILVVDDDPMMLELIEAILTSAGYYVTILANSTKVFDTIKTVKPDLILLDIMMPVSNGYAILKKIRQDETNSIPVIMVTTLGDDANKFFAGVCKASAYITKPIDKKVLLETVASFLPESLS